MPVYRGRTRGTWRVIVSSDGQQREQIVHGTWHAAKQHEATMRLKTPSKIRLRGGLTLDQLIDGPYAAHAETHLGVETWRVRKSQLGSVRAKLGRHRIGELSRADLEAYQAARIREVRRSTVNNEVRVLLTALRWARRVGHRAAVPSVPRLRQPAPRVRAWTAEELQALYEAVQDECPWLLPMIVVLANTGLRQGEARRAEWTWVDWDAQLIRIPVLPDWRPKNGKPRDVPLEPPVRAVLGQPQTGGPLLPRLDGEHYRAWPKQLWQRARDRAGLCGGVHQLRHTYASHFLQTTPDLWLLAQVLGHSHTRTTELYAHLLPGHLERARGAVCLAPKLRRLADGLAECGDDQNEAAQNSGIAEKNSKSQRPRP